MEGLALEGRVLFADKLWGWTVDISSAYPHVDIHPDSQQFQSFFFQGQYYVF